MSRQEVIYISEGTDSAIIAMEFSDLDLSSFSAIALKVKLESGQRMDPIAAVVDDASLGRFHFLPPVGGFPPGTHSAEVDFTDNAGLSLVYPDRFKTLLIVRKR